MLDTNSVILLCGVWTVGLVTPGPDIFMVLNRGLKKGLRGAISSAIGVVLGIQFWILITLIGLGALLARFPQTRTIISILGGSYLIYMGWKTIKEAKSEIEPEALISGKSRNKSDFFAGLMTNLSNPKAMIFFSTLMVRFIPEGSGISTQFEIWLIMNVMAFIWFGSLAIASSRKKLQDLFSSKMHIIDTVAGIIFILFGLTVIYEGLS